MDKAPDPYRVAQPLMDAIGLFIVTLHQLLSHDTAAAFLGQPAGNRSACMLCQYELNPSDRRRQAIIHALAPWAAASGDE
jgi:hypothetical protein